MDPENYGKETAGPQLAGRTSMRLVRLLRWWLRVAARGSSEFQISRQWIFFVPFPFLSASAVSARPLVYSPFPKLNGGTAARCREPGCLLCGTATAR